VTRLWFDFLFNGPLAFCVGDDGDVATARIQSGFMQHHDAITGTSSAALVGVTDRTQVVMHLVLE